MDLSENLKMLRESRGLKKNELAAELHVTPSMISQYECGRSMPSYGILAGIAAFFDVSTDYLLGLSPMSRAEELMRGDYTGDIRVSQMVEMCMTLSPRQREALLCVLEAFEKAGGEDCRTDRE